MQQKGIMGRVAALLSVFLLASGPSIVKISDLPEMTFIFWRLLAAAFGYWIAMSLTGGKLGKNELRSSLKGGIVFGVNLVFFVMAMRRTSAANAVMIGALQPVVLLGVAGRLFGEKPPKVVYFWSLIAMGGVAFFTYASDTTGVATRQGDLLALIGMLLFSAYYVISKQTREELDSMVYQLGLTIAAAVTIIPFAFAFGHGISPPTGGEWWPVILMALLPGAGHWLTNYAHAHVPLVTMSLVNLLFTVVAPIYAWILVEEKLGGAQALGMAVVLIALSQVVTKPIESSS